MRHDSAPKHVAGKASFIDDIREPEGLLHIAVGGAPVAAGQLLGVDLEKVRAAPGVVAVLTAADILGKNDVSPIAGDDPVFVDSKIEFFGQVVFAVVAETREQARKAARLAKVEPRSERRRSRSTTRSRPRRASCRTTASARTTARRRSRTARAG
jgi:xanthine dehydrogenase large subunit